MNKNSKIPLYQQLAEYIKQLISEQCKPGDKLPTEAEFSQQFEVSRITVRKAIELLVEDGYVIRKQGIGTFVAEQKLRRVMTNEIVSFTEISHLDGHEPSAELVYAGWIRPDASVMRHLGVDENDKVIKIVRLRKNDDIPVLIEENYYPERLSFILKENLLGSTYDILRNHGLIPTNSVKKIEVCYANKEEADLLGIKENDILILQKDETTDQNGKCLNYCKQRINPQRYHLTIKLSSCNY